MTIDYIITNTTPVFLRGTLVAVPVYAVNAVLIQEQQEPIAQDELLEVTKAMPDQCMTLTHNGESILVCDISVFEILGLKVCINGLYGAGTFNTTVGDVMESSIPYEDTAQAPEGGIAPM